ncbi:MAG: hypothetical protein WCV90_05810 [Candidatus Woesearchaeota archaeon]|jgi:uncharacterized membrane protein
MSKLAKKNFALHWIFNVSVIGLVFSGYLSYGELFRKVCPIEGGCSNLLGLPVCVYGFIMYLAVFILSLYGLNVKKK